MAVNAEIGPLIVAKQPRQHCAVRLRYGAMYAVLPKHTSLKCCHVALCGPMFACVAKKVDLRAGRDHSDSFPRDSDLSICHSDLQRLVGGQSLGEARETFCGLVCPRLITLCAKTSLCGVLLPSVNASSDRGLWRLLAPTHTRYQHHERNA